MLSRRSLPVLTYHRVIPREQCPGAKRPPNTLFTDEFDAHMTFVARRFHVPGGSELRAFLEGNATLPRYSLAVSFDDGYENNFVHALPVLRRHGLHAMFFVTSGFIGTTGRMFWFDRLDRLLSAVPRAEVLQRLRRLDPTVPDVPGTRLHRWFKTLPHARQSGLLDALERQFGDAELPPADRTVYGLMSWDQVRSLAAAGMTVGSHTANHQILAAVPPDAAREEMLSSRLRIERETGQPCWCFAYPNGERRDFRPEDELSAAGAGYLCAFTQIPGIVNRCAPRYALPRIPIPDTGDLKIFRSYVSGVQRAFRNVFPEKAE
jgi:peptidoglycan/xylan/chitin deacetylase (PgdA/CDA1 family)